MSDDLANYASEREASASPIFPLTQGRLEAYLASKHLGACVGLAGLGKACVFARAWLYHCPADTVHVGADGATVNGRFYRLASWQAERVRRLDAAFPQGVPVTKRQYLALLRPGAAHRQLRARENVEVQTQ